MTAVGDTVTLRAIHGRDLPCEVVAVHSDTVLDLRIVGRSEKPLLKIERSDEPKPFTWRPA